jgi:PPOX class probable F420-dependent enzyme
VNEALGQGRYVLLTSFRRSGAGVATPFGAMRRDGRLYCYTRSTSGKVKRIRRNPSVTLAPCTIRGKPTGPAVPARARVLPDDEATPLAVAFDELWSRQDGLLWQIGKRVERWRGVTRTVIEITPETSLAS